MMITQLYKLAIVVYVHRYLATSCKLGMFSSYLAMYWLDQQLNYTSTYTNQLQEYA